MIEAILRALGGVLVDAFNDWRRDRALQDLGYTKGQRDAAKTGLAIRAEMDRVRSAGPGGVADRLRGGTF